MSHDPELEMAGRLTTMMRDVDVPLPPVDVAGIVRNGQSSLSRRRLLMAGVAVGVTGLAVAGAPAALSAVRERPSRPDPLAPPVPVPAEFDPLQQLFTANALGYREASNTMTAYWQRTRQHIQVVGGASGEMLEIAVFATGRHRSWRYLGSVWHEAVAKDFAGLPAAPRVHGRPAVWLVRQPGQPSRRTTPGGAMVGSIWDQLDPGIAWQYGDGAWAVAALIPPASGELPPQQNTPERKHFIHQMAQSVRILSGEPVAVPFSVPAPPAPLRVVEARWSRPRTESPGWSASLVFADVSAPQDDISRPQIKASVGVDKGPSDRYGPSARDRIVALAQPPGNVGMEVGGIINGNTVSAYADDATLRALGGRDGLIRYASSVTQVPDPDDVKNWTADPLR